MGAGCDARAHCIQAGLCFFQLAAQAIDLRLARVKLASELAGFIVGLCDSIRGAAKHPRIALVTVHTAAQVVQQRHAFFRCGQYVKKKVVFFFGVLDI